MRTIPAAAVLVAFALACMPAAGQPHKPRTFTVDDFPVTHGMFGHCDGCEVM